VLTDKKKNVSFSSDTDLPSVGGMLFEVIFSQKKTPFFHTMEKYQDRLNKEK
jgi:hypothetical protein